MNYHGDLGLTAVGAEDAAFLQRLRDAVGRFFRQRSQLVQRSDRAALYAADLLQYIDADVLLTLTAAHLCEIGCPAAEKSHGRLYERVLGQENRKAADMLLRSLHAKRLDRDRICLLLGDIMHPHAHDLPEFRILLDARNLINLAAIEIEDKDQLKAYLNKTFLTEPGHRMAGALMFENTPCRSVFRSGGR